MSWPKGKTHKQNRLYQASKRWRERNRAKGLTVCGKPRKHGAWHRHHDLDHLPKTMRRRIVKARWLQRERYSKGLTQFGKPRVIRPLPPVEQAWRNFKAQVERETIQQNTKTYGEF